MFCYLMHTPPPRSPLFPYTTLFRSLPRRGDDRSGRLGQLEPPHEPPPPHLADPRRPGREPGEVRGRGLMWGDRKSTRLNSSHPSISYAVFCLKKKISEAAYVFILKL